jgi:hypothetical protein
MWSIGKQLPAGIAQNSHLEGGIPAAGKIEFPRRNEAREEEEIFFALFRTSRFLIKGNLAGLGQLIAEFRQHGYNMSGLLLIPLKMEERNDSYHYQPVRA